MTLYEFINTIKTVSLKKKGVEEFRDGDVYEQMNSKMHRYPAIVLTISTINRTENRQLVNCTLFYIDRLTDDASNKTEIQSNGLTCLKQIIEKLNEDNTWNFANEIYTPFSEKFSDMCAGVFVSGIFSISEDIICADDSFTIKELKVAKNGIYDVVGYDKVIVDVKGKEVEQTISAQLTYNGLEIGNNVIEAGKDEFISKATVTIPEKIDFDLGNLGFGGSRIPNFNNYNFVGRTSIMTYKFAGCEDVTEIDLSNMQFSRSSDWKYCFANCKKLEYIKFPNGTLSQFKQTAINDATKMFSYCENLTFKTWTLFYNFLSKMPLPEYVSSFNHMFEGCIFPNSYWPVKIFEKLVSLHTVGLFGGIFKYADIGTDFNPKQDIVIQKNLEGDFSEMFMSNRNGKLKNVDMTIVPRNTIVCDSMFKFSSSIKTITLRFKKYEGDTPNLYISQYNEMFYLCSGLEELNLLGPINFSVKKTEDIAKVFKNCRNLKTINVTNESLVAQLKTVLTASSIPDGQVTINVINQ